jgi:hypothetical protein
MPFLSGPPRAAKAFWVGLSIGWTSQWATPSEGGVTMQRQIKAVEPTVPNAATMWNIDPQSIEAVTKTYRAWFSQVNRLRDETMRFIQEQITKELEAAAQLARCTNPTEAFAVQAEFANKMAADYFAAGQKIVELMGEMAKEISSSPDGKTHH